MTLGLTFLSLMSNGRIIFSILKNLTLRVTLSLTLRDTLGRTPKVTSNQSLFSRFQL